MKINTAVVIFYRRVAFAILALFFAGILSYVSLVVFYVASNSWAAPVVLSPTQEKVLSFQPQISNIELKYNTQKAELENALLRREAILDQLVQLTTLGNSISSISKAESYKASQLNRKLASLLKLKTDNLARTDTIIEESKKLLSTVDQELKANIITEDQAAQRKLSIQAAVNSSSEVAHSMLQIEEQIANYRDLISSLQGNPRAITSLGVLNTSAEIERSRLDLRVQLDVLSREVKVLKQAVDSDGRILELAKTSPYYKALFKPVTLAFVPYENLKYAFRGTPVYSCLLSVIICERVGTVTTRYPAEEFARHPIFKTDMRGNFIEIEFIEEKYSKEPVVFLNGKPFIL